jgi:hypothetical protein
MAKRSKPSSDNEEYSPTKRAKSSVPRYLTRHSTRRTARTRSQSNQPPYVRDPNNSDDSEGLVTTAPGGRNNSRRKRVDYYMSGALTEGAIKWNSTMRKGYSREANKEEYERQRSEAMKKIGASFNADGELQGGVDLQRALLESGDAVTTESGETGSTESGETSTTASGETGTEENDTTAAEGAGGKQPQDPIQDATQPDQALSSSSSSQTQELVKNLGKRASPDQEDSGSHDGSSVSPKSSKRQKTTHQQAPRKLSDVLEETKESSLPLYSDDTNDFKPDDESTPFNKFHTNTAAHPTIPSSPPDFGFRKRPRKSKTDGPKIQVPGSPNAIAKETPHSSPPELNQAAAQEDENEPDASEPELPSHPPARAQRELTPPELPEWMAPPASSSSPVKSLKVTPQKLPGAADKKKPKNLSSKDLQSMLPKRRPQAHSITTDEFDIPDDESDDASAEGGSDEDELSYLPQKKATKSRARGTTRSVTPTTTTAGPKSKGKPPRKKSLLESLTDAKNAKATKTNATPASKAKGKAPATFAKPAKTTPLKTSTTVGTTDGLDRPPSASSNKENRAKPFTSSPLSTTPSNASETLDSESNLALPPPKGVAKSNEIKNMAKKFNEVDEWSLDFEDNSLANSSDQAKR